MSTVDMTEHLRTHIVAIGYDSTRVTEPLLQRKADRVHFLRYTKDKKSPYYDFIEKELKEKAAHIEIIPYFLDLWDLYESIKKYREIIQNENKEQNHVYVNISTGSKITSIAGMLSCMSWGATPYYVHVVYPSPKRSKKIPLMKVKNIDDLPVYGINKPPPTNLKILKILNENKKKMRKSDLILALEGERIIIPKESIGSDFTIHAKHSQLRAILAPMENDWKFVEIFPHGKQSDVILTEQGEKALKIFGD